MRPSRTLEVLETLARRALTLASSAFAGNVGPHASTIAELTTYGAGLRDGVVGWVDSVRTYWTLVLSAPGLAIDNITVAATSLGGDTRWVRTSYVDGRWTSYTTWYVDFTNGSDEGAGDVLGRALKTLGELVRRVGYSATFTHNVDIFTFGDHTPADALRINWTLVSTPDNFGLVNMRRVRFYANAPVPDYTGIFTATQAIVRATNTPASVTNALDPWPVSTVFPPVGGPYVRTTSDGWRLRIVGGPRNGAVAWVANGLGAGGATRRTTNWIIEDPDPALGFTETTPQPGDTYVREWPPMLFIDDVRVSGNVGSCDWWSYVCFDGYDVYGRHGFDTQATVPTWIQVTNFAGGFVIFRNCNIETSLWATQLAANSSCYVLNCSSYPLAFAGIGFVYVDAGSVHAGAYAASGARVIVDGGAMANASGWVALNGGTMMLNDVCAFGTPTHAYPGTIAAEHLGILLLGASFYTGVCSVWGSVGGPYGLAVIEGAQFEADPALLPGVTLTAAWGEFCVGPPQTPGIPAVAVAWDNSTNPPSLTTKRNCTWANLAAPIGAGGFNFNVQDLDGRENLEGVHLMAWAKGEGGMWHRTTTETPVAAPGVTVGERGPTPGRTAPWVAICGAACTGLRFVEPCDNAPQCPACSA